MRCKFSTIIALLVMLISLSPISAKQTLRQRIVKHLAPLKRIKVDYGIMIVSAKDGKVLFSINPDLPLMPASNEKLVTTISAITRLGENFQFRTLIGLLGNDLVIIGDGDPGFGDTQITKEPACAIFDRWAQTLIRKGITKINGNLIFDDTVFDNVWRHPSWPADQFNKWYTAPVCGLNLNDNCIDIQVKLNEMHTGQLIIKPFTNTITVNTQWLTNHTRETIINAGWQSENQLLLKITLGDKSAGPVNLPVLNPRSFFANICRERLESYGISIAGKTIFQRVRTANGTVPENFVKLAEHTTPLFDDVKRANKKSQNLFAECLFKRTGFAFAQKYASFPVGSWTTGRFAVRDFLTDRYAISDKSVRIDDGGGLSRKNRISVRLLCKLLQFASHQQWANKFIDTLAIAGIDGTLRRRMRNTAATGRIRAKTGYISSVSALSGYLVNNDGEIQIIFSMLFNNFPRAKLWQIKQIQDRICIELAKEFPSSIHRK